jgi:phosphatidylglycerol---prolipoprotein diacylglyceryl transferase
MYPIISIGPAALPTYPLLFLVALWAGMWLAARRAQQLGLDGDHVYNAGLYGFLAGIIGARLYFVLSHWENYATDLTQVFSLSRSALSVGEGFLIAGVVVLIYLLRKRVPVGTFFDAAAPGLALGIIIANIGAFLGGVALGAVTEVPWAVKIAGIARHPVQLYDAAAGVVILVSLTLLRNYQPWPGFQFWLFVILYGTARLFFEIFRARPYLIGDSYLGVQVLALAAIVVALAVMAYNFTRDSAEESPVESV